MNSISNTGFLKICGNCDCGNMIPSLTYSYNAGTKALTVTDATNFGAGDSFGKVNVTVSDGQGTTKKGQILVAGGNVVIDLSTGGLKLGAGGIHIFGSVVSTARCTADLSAYNVPIGAAATGTITKP